jgi:hypothetical protein
MDSLLAYAYLEDRCSLCNAMVPVTLQEVLLEQQSPRTWRPVRPFGGCMTASGQAANTIPPHELAQLAAAWDALSAALAARGVPLVVGDWQAREVPAWSWPCTEIGQSSMEGASA